MNQVMFGFKEHKEFKKNKPWSAVPMTLAADNFNTPPHYAETVEINIYENVSGDAYISGQHFSLDGNVVYFIAPNIVHTMRYKHSAGTVTALKINQGLLNPILNIEALLQYYGKSYYDLPVVLPYSDEISEIKQAFLGDDINEASIAILRLFKLLITNADSSGDEDRIISFSAGNELRNIISWTEQNFTKKITLDDAAAIMGYSKFYFCKKFKDATGTTYLTYLNKMRIYHACKLLKQGNTLDKVCDSCGFDDMSYFIQLFKKIMGITPKKYSSQALK